MPPSTHPLPHSPSQTPVVMQHFRISNGSATSVAWHATKNHFALVTDAMPAAPPLPTPDPKKKKGKDSKAEAAAAAAAAAARRSSEVPALVQVREWGGLERCSEEGLGFKEGLGFRGFRHPGSPNPR